MQKLKNVKRYAKISDMPSNQRSLIHREAWFPPCFVRQNQQKKTFKQKCSNLRPLLNIFSPKDSESLKILDMRLQEVGAKRRLNGTSKVNTQTDGQTDRQTDRRTNRHIKSVGPEGRCFENWDKTVLKMWSQNIEKNA